MRLTVRDFKHLVRLHLEAAGPEEDHTPFQAGAVMELVRPVRVTPIAHGDWADMDTRGVLGYEGGEDSPGARREKRPRGITATILKPGTQIRVNKAGKNEALVTPMEADGTPIVDEKTGNPLDSVKVHINKVCPHCAGVYKSGKQGSRGKPQAVEDKIARLRAKIAKQQAELQALSGGQDEWGDKTDPDIKF